MPKTRRITRADSRATFDPTTPSTWPSASLAQLKSLTVAALQQELKSRNLRHTGNKAVLSQRLHDALKLQADTSTQIADSTPTVTGQASIVTPTVTSQHSNTTASHIDATAAESLRLLSSQLQQLPQPQLTNLLLQAISGGSQMSQPQVTIASTSPPAPQAQLVTPTSGTTVTPTSLPAAGPNLSSQSSANNQELLHQQQLMNMLIQAFSSGTQLTQSHVTPSQMTIPTSTTIPTSSRTYNLNLPTSEQEDRLSEASGHVPPIQPSPGSLNEQVEPHTQEPAVLGTTHPPLIPPVPARLRTRILSGEYIDFNTLLAHAIFSVRDPPNAQQHMQTFTLQMSSQSGELHLAPTPSHSKKINSFALWMVAWNLYVSTILSAKPSRALEMFGYQCIITSLNLHLPLSAWMTYDIKFHTLAASYPMLRWDVRHLDT